MKQSSAPAPAFAPTRKIGNNKVLKLAIEIVTIWNQLCEFVGTNDRIGFLNIASTCFRQIATESAITKENVDPFILKLAEISAEKSKENARKMLESVLQAQQVKKAESMESSSSSKKPASDEEIGKLCKTVLADDEETLDGKDEEMFETFDK